MVDALQDQIKMKASYEARAKMEDEIWRFSPTNKPVCQEGLECTGCNKKEIHTKYPRNQLSKKHHVHEYRSSKKKGKHSYADKYEKTKVAKKEVSERSAK